MSWMLAMAFSAGTLNTTVGVDGLVTHFAQFKERTCLAIVCDCGSISGQPIEAQGRLELMYWVDPEYRQAFPFVFESHGDVVVIRQLDADYTDNDVAIGNLKLRMGNGLSYTFRTLGEFPAANLEAYQEACARLPDTVEEAEKTLTRPREASTPNTPSP